MMKLQFEVVRVDHARNTVELEPRNCSLSGRLIYRGLPRRAAEQFRGGQVVEAAIATPDHYPAPDLALLAETLKALEALIAAYPVVMCFGATANLRVVLRRSMELLEKREPVGVQQIKQWACGVAEQCKRDESIPDNAADQLIYVAHQAQAFVDQRMMDAHYSTPSKGSYES